MQESSPLRFFKTIWYVLTLQCEEADRISVMACAHQATRVQRLAAWLHRLGCRSCRIARAQLLRLEEMLRDVADSDADQLRQMPQEIRSRLAERLRARSNPPD